MLSGFKKEKILEKDKFIEKGDGGDPSKMWRESQSFESDELLAIDVENPDLKSILKELEDGKIRTQKNSYDKSLNILILRNPYNLTASRIKGSGLRAALVALPLWEDHALEFLGDTNYLGSNCVKILFDSWFSSDFYRNDISKKIEVHPDPEMVHKVADSGWIGSSFDGLSIKDARDMKVLDRWKYYLKDRQFSDIFRNNPKVNELAFKIFGNFARYQYSEIVK